MLQNLRSLSYYWFFNHLIISKIMLAHWPHTYATYYSQLIAIYSTGKFSSYNNNITRTYVLDCNALAMRYTLLLGMAMNYRFLCSGRIQIRQNWFHAWLSLNFLLVIKSLNTIQFKTVKLVSKFTLNIAWVSTWSTFTRLRVSLVYQIPKPKHSNEYMI